MDCEVFFTDVCKLVHSTRMYVPHDAYTLKEAYEFPDWIINENFYR